MKSINLTLSQIQSLIPNDTNDINDINELVVNTLL